MNGWMEEESEGALRMPSSFSVWEQEVMVILEEESTFALLSLFRRQSCIKVRTPFRATPAGR